MELSDILAYITPENAVVFAICATAAAFALWKEIIVSGPRYRATEKKLERSERRERAWQRLYLITRLAAGRAADVAELELELEECE